MGYCSDGARPEAGWISNLNMKIWAAVKGDALAKEEGTIKTKRPSVGDLIGLIKGNDPQIRSDAGTQQTRDKTEEES